MPPTRCKSTFPASRWRTDGCVCQVGRLIINYLLETVLEAVFVEGDEHHDDDPDGHAGNLHSDLEQLRLAPGPQMDVLMASGSAACAVSGATIVVFGSGDEGVGVARVQLGDHVDERDVKEDAGGGAEDPRRPVVKVAQDEAKHHADQGQNRAEQTNTWRIYCASIVNLN